MAETVLSERDERLKKLEEIMANSVNPYPAKTKRSHAISEVMANFSTHEKGQDIITLAGRLMSKRSHGNLSFINLQDGSGKIQVAFSKKEVGVEAYKYFTKLLDVADFVEVSGVCFVTHKSEKSLMAKEFRLLTKALKPLPDKFHGLKDEEERFRKRYLDILTNPELKKLFEKKAQFWSVTRKFMKDKGFFEVETPTLETTTGGAEATPFRTHHNDYDIDMYLRISVGELWQKRLMAAGFDKTFEIGRIYRNEGSSPEHLQEFTNMEFYWAYANYNDGMKFTQELYQVIAKEVFGTTKFKTKEHSYDLAGDWPEIDYREEIIKQTGIDVLGTDEKKMADKLDELNVKYEGTNRERLTDTLWKYCRKNISGPAFLVNHPKLISPLAKSKDDNPELTERFQILIAGAEVGNGYSELNNPVEQRLRFEGQQKLLDAGDVEAMMPDWEFVEMLEHGMPPTCGFGFGERLFWFLVDKPARETLLFPLVKPKQDVGKAKITHPAPPGHPSQEGNTSALGINYEQAQAVLDKYVTDDITRLHMVETEAIMRALAKHFGEDEEKWGIIGLLHDIDWDLTKQDIKNHTIKAVDILREAGATDFLINSVVSHAYGNKECGEYPEKTREGRLEHSLVAAETLTGLIIAATLVQPDKKLASVKLSSLKKKFKQKAFAANCDRELIREIEKTGLSLDDFLELGLKSLQGIANDLKL